MPCRKKSFFHFIKLPEIPNPSTQMMLDTKPLFSTLSWKKASFFAHMVNAQKYLDVVIKIMMIVRF